MIPKLGERLVLGALLDRALPLPPEGDKEARDERRLLHRIEIREAVRK